MKSRLRQNSNNINISVIFAAADIHTITARVAPPGSRHPRLASNHILMANRNHFRQRSHERGYVLLILLLFIALLSIGFMAMVERLDFQAKRDREDELIHRGVQYSRAVRSFVKKFGRYPNTIEELENTNNIRFLRKRYKDPVTGKDFKVLHNSDLIGFSSSSLGVSVANIAAQQQAAPAPLNASPQAAARPMRSPIVNPVYPGGPPADTVPDTDNPQSASTDDSSANPDSTASAAAPQDTNPASGAQAPVFTTGGVVGVASVSKAKTIRVFNKQDHYNQWQFAYDPSTDKGLMKTPRVPLLPMVAQQMNQDGAPVPRPSQNLPQDAGTQGNAQPAQQ